MKAKIKGISYDVNKDHMLAGLVQNSETWETLFLNKNKENYYLLIKRYGNDTVIPITQENAFHWLRKNDFQDIIDNMDKVKGKE